ncbi:FAH family protein [Kitasatospora sp. NPDC089797]|uniref:FAH family protein n=1 Tax=Kitasatospora sp. NPDC089797 TaxID=3155298 RepID=UPI0034344F27
MMVLTEYDYEGRSYFAVGAARSGAALRLYPLFEEQLAVLVRESGGDAAALTAGREPVDVPAGESAGLRPRVPCFPGHPGDALVGGFMMTHNVKVDETTPDQPTWFFKGLGDTLRLPGEPLDVPGGALAVCEEAEVVLVYVGDEETGRPRYLGYTFGNDLTDIGRFKAHNGHLSYAKLCSAGISPALHLGPPPALVTGETTIERDGTPVWKGTFTTGTDALYYDLDTITAGLFVHEALHRPGRVHYVYIGADRSSFHGGHTMLDGDRVTLDFRSHGVTLTHPLVWTAGPGR